MPHVLIHNQSVFAFRCPIAKSPSLFSPQASAVCLRRPGRRRLTTTTTCGGCGNGENRIIICMANPRRVKMVAKQIRRELSDMLLTDKVLQYAVLPEAALGADRYLSSLTTISDVEVSADLQIVKVYVSVFGDERGKEVALAGLKSKAKYVRSMLGKRMKLRLTPEIRFLEDESLERGSRVIAILDRLKEESSPKGSIYDEDDDFGESVEGLNGDVGTAGGGDELDDESIIYVE